MNGPSHRRAMRQCDCLFKVRAVAAAAADFADEASNAERGSAKASWHSEEVVLWKRDRVRSTSLSF